MAGIYHSRFCRADSRQTEVSGGCRMFTSYGSEAISIRDIFLEPGALLTINGTAQVQDILLPVVGSFVLATAATEQQIHPGFVYSCPQKNGSLTTIHNTEPETINLLHISITTSEHTAAQAAALPVTKKNRLCYGEGLAAHIAAGVYDSRSKENILLPGDKNALVLYVINGSFEAEGRLMEYRDSLLLKDIRSAELEALSENAIIVTIFYTH